MIGLAASGIDLFLRYPSLRLAALGAILVAILCATLGLFVVLRGLSMLGDGLAHISFAGVALGLVLGIYPLAFAMIAAILGAIAIHTLKTRNIVHGDTAIGILFTAGLATGVLIISRAGNLGVNVTSYLFGNILSIQPTDVIVISIVGGALLMTLIAFYKEFFYMTFSEEAAQLSGLPTGILNILFVSLTAATIVVAARIVGVLLVSALLIVPAASSLQLAKSFRAALTMSILFALGSVLAGLYASATYGTATGASIALASTLLFGATLIARAIVRARPVRAA